MRLDRLREWREFRGVSQVDLASRAGVARCQISYYETGKAQARKDTAARIASVLGVKAEDLATSPDRKPKRVSASEGLRLIEQHGKQRKKQSQMSRFKAKFEGEIAALPKPETEVKFHPKRQWRLDYAWPDAKVAVELQGGIFGRGGHVRGVQYSKDREKMVEAQLLGWIVFEITEVHMRERNIAAWIEEALNMRASNHNTPKRE